MRIRVIYGYIAEWRRQCKTTIWIGWIGYIRICRMMDVFRPLGLLSVQPIGHSHSTWFVSLTYSPVLHLVLDFPHDVDAAAGVCCSICCQPFWFTRVPYHHRHCAHHAVVQQECWRAWPVLVASLPTMICQRFRPPLRDVVLLGLATFNVFTRVNAACHGSGTRGILDTFPLLLAALSPWVYACPKHHAAIPFPQSSLILTHPYPPHTLPTLTLVILALTLLFNPYLLTLTALLPHCNLIPAGPLTLILPYPHPGKSLPSGSLCQDPPVIVAFLLSHRERARLIACPPCSREACPTISEE